MKAPARHPGPLPFLLATLILCLAGCWSTPAEPPTPTTAPSASALPTLTPAQRELAQARAALLVSLVGTTPDPLAPAGPVKAALLRVNEALASWPRVAVFDGVPYPGLEVRVDGQVCSIVPASAPPGTTGIPVAPPTADRAKLLAACGGPVQAQVVGLVLDRLTTDPGARLPDSKIRSLLDKQAKAGLLASYRYDPAHDNLDLTLPDEDIPWRIHPHVEAEAIRRVLQAASAPRATAEDLVKSWHERMDRGDVLVVDTKGSDRLRDFVARPSLAADLSVLTNDALSSDEKLLHLALGDSPPPSADGTGPESAPPPAAAPPGSTAELLNRPGTVVPPSRLLTFLKGPDYYVRPHLNIHAFGREPYDLRAFKDPRGPFRAYHASGYGPVEATTVDWGEPFVEGLARVLEDDTRSVVFFHTHGDDRALLAEMYDLGAADFARDDPTWVDYRRRMDAFKARVGTLRQAYGEDAIRVYFLSARLSPEDRRLLGDDAALVPADYAHLLTEKSKFGVVAVTDSFFAARGAKKALFILMACYGGSMAPSLKARVVLAPDPRSFTTGQLFIESDLTKLGPCLLQSTAPLPVKTTKQTMRTYDLVAAFKAPPPWREGMRPAEEAALVSRFTGEPGRMASIRLYGAAGETVTPSPHVTIADATHVVFNAPMDASIPAPTVVRVTCPDAPSLVARYKDLTPTWKGDTELLLPWKDKVYRDWKPADLSATGRPRVKVAIVTVSHRTALSAVSRVELTGNPDVCTGAGFKTPDAWKDFAPLRQATQARTDFVMLFPCLDEEVPPPTDRVVAGGDLVQHVMVRKEAPYNGLELDLAIDGSLAIDHGESMKRHNAVEGYPNDVPIVQLDGGGHQAYAAFGGHMAWVRSTVHIRSTKNSYLELLYDGSPVFRSEDHDVADPQLFGNNLSYYTVHRAGTQKGYHLIWNGRSLDPALMGGRHLLSSTSILGINEKHQVALNGTVLGEAAPSSYLVRDNDTSEGSYGVFLFRDNAAFISPDGHGKLVCPARGAGLMDLGQADQLVLFGDHVAFQRDATFPLEEGSIRGECSYSSIVYDGRDLGPGEAPYLFGDHLAFVTRSNPRERTGPCYTMQTSSSAFENHGRYIFVDGVYHDAEKKLASLLGPDASGYTIANVRIFGGHLAFVLRGADDGDNRVIYDWKDRGPCTGDAPLLFQDHLVFTRDVGDERHVIYDGRDLGAGTDPVIYGSHVAFPMASGEHYADGRAYPEPTSVYDNIRAAYRYYLENEVTCSPYGSVTFDPPRGR